MSQGQSHYGTCPDFFPSSYGNILIFVHKANIDLKKPP